MMNQAATLLSAACVASLLNAPQETPESQPDREPVVVVKLPAASVEERTVIVQSDPQPVRQPAEVCVDGVCFTPPQRVTVAPVARTRISQPATVRYVAAEPTVARGGTSTTYCDPTTGRCYTTTRRTYKRRWFYRR